MVKREAIIKKAANTKKYLGTPKITPFQLLWAVVGIFYFIYMETDLFSGLPDLVKVIIWAGFIVICLLLGVSLVNVKKIAEDLKTVYVNKNMTPLEKVNAFGNIALSVLSRLGEAWDLLNEEQFKEKEKEE